MSENRTDEAAPGRGAVVGRMAATDDGGLAVERRPYALRRSGAVEQALAEYRRAAETYGLAGELRGEAHVIRSRSTKPPASPPASRNAGRGCVER